MYIHTYLLLYYICRKMVGMGICILDRKMCVSGKSKRGVSATCPQCPSPALPVCICLASYIPLSSSVKWDYIVFTRCMQAVFLVAQCYTCMYNVVICAIMTTIHVYVNNIRSLTWSYIHVPGEEELPLNLSSLLGIRPELSFEEWKHTNTILLLNNIQICTTPFWFFHSYS